jgi:hypothetical protein
MGKAHLYTNGGWQQPKNEVDSFFRETLILFEKIGQEKQPLTHYSK